MPKPEIKTPEDNFDNQKACIAVLSMWADDGFHSSKGLADREPFLSLVKTEAWELENITNPDLVEKYKEKKRRLIYDMIQALKFSGFLDIKAGTRTTNSVYFLTRLGKKFLNALKEDGELLADFSGQISQIMQNLPDEDYNEEDEE